MGKTAYTSLALGVPIDGYSGYVGWPFPASVANLMLFLPTDFCLNLDLMGGVPEIKVILLSQNIRRIL